MPVTNQANRSSLPTHLLNVVRGGLIGTAETVPGVSGGTVALVVGVYDDVIGSAGHFLSGLRLALVDVPRRRGWARAGAEFGRVKWGMIIPLLVGMVVALVIMARLMERWVHDYPVHTRALFFGLVLASLWVPYSLATRGPDGRQADGWRWRDAALAAVAAVAAYLVVSLPPGEVRPSPLVIVVAAAVAVSALVLPGLSGSFLLLTFGLYGPTLSAVNDRDFGYLGLFALGAFVGLATIVKVLQWLLEHRHRVTLVVLTGVMAGCLRALWPWQTESRQLLAPGEHTGAATGLALLGVAVVVAVLVTERRISARRQREPEPGHANAP